MPPLLGMLITGVLPVIAIGAGLTAIVAGRKQRTRTAMGLSIVALVAFGASVWVYFAVLSG